MSKHSNRMHVYVLQHSNTCKVCGNFLTSRWHITTSPKHRKYLESS